MFDVPNNQGLVPRFARVLPGISPNYHGTAQPEFACPGNLLSYKETFPILYLRKAISSIFPPTSCSRHSTQKLSMVSQSRAHSCISLAFYPFPCRFFYAGLKQSREQAAVPSLPVSTAAEALKAGSGLSSSHSQEREVPALLQIPRAPGCLWPLNLQPKPSKHPPA